MKEAVAAMKDNSELRKSNMFCMYHTTYLNDEDSEDKK